MERLKWLFEIIDRVSGPAKQMSGSLGGVEKVLGRLGQKFGLLERKRDAMGRLTKEFGPTRMGAAIGATAGGIMVAAQAVWSLGEAFAGAAYEATKFAIKQVAFRESTMVSLELMLGNSKDAQDFYNQALFMAKKTPFETTDVISAFKQLKAAGFSKEDVPVLFQGLGDVAAASGFNPTVIDAITRQLAQMKAIGKVTMMDLRPIIGWTAEAGVGFKQFYEQLSKMTGKSVVELQAMQQAGQLSADLGISALMEAIANVSGGKIGNLMEKQSTTLIGLWSTMKSAPGDLFAAMDANATDKGVASLKGAMQNVIAAFDTTTSAGKQMSSMLASAFNEIITVIFGNLSGPGGMQKMRDTIVALTEFIKGLVYVIKGVGYAFYGLYRIVDAAANILAVAAFGVWYAWDWLTTKLGAAWDWLAEVGTNLMKGLAWGIEHGVEWVMEAISNLASSVIGTMKEKLGINSPSRVFQQLGAYTAQGFDKGLEGTGSLAAGAGSVEVQPASAGRAPMNLTMNLDLRGVAREDAEDIAERVRRAVLEVLGDLAVEGGAV